MPSPARRLADAIGIRGTGWCACINTLGLEPVLVPRGRLAAVKAVLRPNTEGRQRSAVEALTGIPGDDPP